MADYMITEESTYTQEAWKAEKTPDGRPLKPVRPARDEHVITVRLNRQFTATVRVDSASLATNKSASIVNACFKATVGQEIAPGIQVVEYEAVFIKAQEGYFVDKKGQDTPEQYRAPQKERLSHRFTIRRNGADLMNFTLEDNEFKKANWKTLLASRVPIAESFSQ